MYSRTANVPATVQPISIVLPVRRLVTCVLQLV
jgi:hypothetical protein